MTSSVIVRLQTQFHDDQRRLTRGLARLHRTLRQRHWVEVQAAVERLREEAGDHLGFLEDSFFPWLIANRVDVETARLKGDQVEAVELLDQLLGDPPAGDGEWRLLVERLRSFVDHATRCGSLARRLGGRGI